MLETAGYGTDLAQPGPFTFFAPTNEAFAALDEATLDRLTTDPAAADALLRDLAVEGALTADELATGDAAHVRRRPIEVVVDGDTITVQRRADRRRPTSRLQRRRPRPRRRARTG